MFSYKSNLVDITITINNYCAIILNLKQSLILQFFVQTFMQTIKLLLLY